MSEKALMMLMVEQMKLSLAVAKEFKAELEDYKKLVRSTYFYKVQHRIFENFEIKEELEESNN